MDETRERSIREAATPSTGVRLAGSDGLRALAAASVFFHHVYLAGRPAGTPAYDLPGPMESFAVDFKFGLMLFFVLSGYLLFRPFAAAIVHGEALPDVRGYLRNRALRVAPAYWVILLATVFVLGTGAFAGGTGAPDLAPLVADALLLQNFHPDTVLTGIGPAWSLAVECVFYLVLPLLAMGALALGVRTRRPVAAVLAAPALLIGIGLASKLFMRFGLPADSTWHFVAQTAFITHADVLGYGMAAAVIHVLAVDGRLSLPARWRGMTLGAGLVLILSAASLKPWLGYSAGTPTDALAGAAFALLLVAVVLPRSDGVLPAGTRLLELRPIVWLGTVSYSVYLWHVPLILLLRDRGLEATGARSTLVMAVAAGALTLALSALTFRFVEAPAMARKKRTSLPRLEPATASGLGMPAAAAS